MAFGKQAVRSQAKLKIALEGPPGVGKTYSALLMAKELSRTKIGLLDSENGRALKAAGQPGIPEQWLHEPMSDPTIQDYLDRTDAAEAESVDVLIYDSWSHSWISALEAVDAMGGNKFSNGWKAISPLVKKLIRKMLAYPGHCIATMRVDTDWAMEKDDKGKVVPQKIGLKTVAGKGVDYEFDWVLRFIGGNKLCVMKTTNEALLSRDSIIDRADLPKIARRLVDWLNEGAALTPLEVASNSLRFASDLDALKRVAQTVIPTHLQQHPEDRERLQTLYKDRAAELASGAMP